MTGLEEAKKFYLEAGAQMIAREFPDYEGRVAVGLAGHGSECFGFDDDISRDHDFEVGFCMWLTDEDEAKIGFALTRAYDKLRREYGAGKSAHLSVAGHSAQGVMRIGDFYRPYTGSDGAPTTLREWLFTDSEYFAEATNGEVFRDDLGVFSAIRKELLCGMPEDVRLKKIAACAIRMAQTGQYNFWRCVSREEYGAAAVALTEFVKNAIQIAFLLNRKHCPYYKWMFRAMSGLERLGELRAPLEFLLTSDNDAAGLKVKREMADDIALAIANEIRAQGLADCEGSYLEPYAYAVQKRIRAAELRNMHILLG